MLSSVQQATVGLALSLMRPWYSRQQSLASKRVRGSWETQPQRKTLPSDWPLQEYLVYLGQRVLESITTFLLYVANGLLVL